MILDDFLKALRLPRRKEFYATGAPPAPAPAKPPAGAFECVVHAHCDYVSCPHCNGDAAGFVMDPRGATDITCEECGAKFDIPETARVILA